MPAHAITLLVPQLSPRPRGLYEMCDCAVRPEPAARGTPPRGSPAYSPIMRSIAPESGLCELPTARPMSKWSCPGSSM